MTAEEDGDNSDNSSVNAQIPEYTTNEINETAVFGNDQGMYELILETDTFSEDSLGMTVGLDTFPLDERQGDWIRLSRGDIWFDISYIAAENVDKYLISITESGMLQYYLQQTGMEPLDELREFVHEMTKPVETDKYKIPEMLVSGQACKVTCYEYPLRFSLLDADMYQDAMDLAIIYRVDMPNGDALFFRGTRGYKTTCDFMVTQALDVWAIDTNAGETLHDITEERFIEYVEKIYYSPNTSNLGFLDELDTMYASAFRLEEGLCELMESIVITAH